MTESVQNTSIEFKAKEAPSEVQAEQYYIKSIILKQLWEHATCLESEIFQKGIPSESFIEMAEELAKLISNKVLK